MKEVKKLPSSIETPSTAEQRSMKSRAKYDEFPQPMNVGSNPATSDYINFDDVMRFIRRYAPTIAVTTLIAISLAALFVFFSVAQFTARTQIVIDPSTPQFRESTGDRLVSMDSSQVESQLAVLRSEKIAMSVIKKLDLGTNPEFMAPASSILDRVLGLFLRSEVERNDFVKERTTLYRFLSGLNVRRVGISYAINISFTSPSPQLSAEISNATAEAYIDEVISAKALAANQGSRWLEARIDKLRKQMNDAALRVQEFRSKRDYRIAKNRNKTTNGRSAQPDKRRETSNQISLEELESQAQTFREIYASYLSAYTEVVQRQSYPVSNARVITLATTPLFKSHPRTKLILAFGALLGCIAGFGIALIRHSLDLGVRSPRQIREEIGLEHLCNIPLMNHQQYRLPTIRELFWRSRPPARLSAVVDLPFSGFSHGVKRLKASISLAGRTRSIRCIGIASSLPNEGKTTISANLANLYATSGKRTLIIDCDLRNSSLSRQLGVKTMYGVIEAVKSSVELEQCVQRVNDNGLDIMPAIDSESAGYLGEVLASEQMRLLLERLAELYEIIIVELPPLAVVADGLAISPALDSVVVVAEWGATPLPVLSEVARSLRNARADILGVVINKVDPSTANYGKSQSSYFSYMSTSTDSHSR